MNLGLLKRAFKRTLYIKPLVPYRRFLKSISDRDDTWIVSQGEFITWWQQRASNELNIFVRNGICHIKVDLENAIIENFQGEFHASPEFTIECLDSCIDGKVQITIDKNLPQRELLKEALRSEGILYFKEASSGELFLSDEISPLLENLSSALRHRDLEQYHCCMVDVREIIADRLAQNGLPLLRIWYQPCINGRIIKVAVSPRFDVERAIDNMPKIWELERNFGAMSTVHLRTFCPFYDQHKIYEIAKHPSCPEIALHGEFVGHASKFGGLVEAAHAEKKHLEQITGQEVIGVSLHGGELLENNTPEARKTVSSAGFLYNASLGPTPYHFPYRLQNKNGTFEAAYRIHANFGDIRIPYSKRYAQDFFAEAIHQLEFTSEYGGILVMMFHPMYFDLSSYLFNLSNLTKLLLFLPVYLVRLVNARRSI